MVNPSSHASCHALKSDLIPLARVAPGVVRSSPRGVVFRTDSFLSPHYAHEYNGSPHIRKTLTRHKIYAFMESL